ncbi:MAG: exo-alpha-sialidase [Caldilineaceae bacterium SB0661_bin_32]|uniref:Exo-alpha-sialidase n=1 Tax=Caldilineaceae bacterium SB0661_bin_32 TaxID=2605255 RepID=A0A6B1D5T9_9CHLR|nr:exo-alpha-sialidase [Caldilineaceae bacterium SB0661_bin_32]
MQESRVGESPGAFFEDVHVVKMPRRFVGYRGSAGDVELLGDGRLLLAYTGYRENAGEGSIFGDIEGRFSLDRGRSWGEPFLLVGRPKHDRKDETCQHPSFLRLANGQLLLTYIYFAGSHPRFAHTYYRRSTDDGATWGDQFIVTPHAGTNHVFNDKLIQLPSGRILAPCEREIREEGGDHRGYVSAVFYSDDDGYSWRQSENVVDMLPVEAQEPHVVPLRDGRVMMLCRTYSGYVVRSYSDDEGVTWSPGEAVRSLKLPTNSSALNVKRIPSTGDLVLLRSTGTKGRFRTPFVSTISTDEGLTWSYERAIGSDPDDDYGYPSLTFIDDVALVSYHKRDGIYVARIGIDWFYGN